MFALGVLFWGVLLLCLCSLYPGFAASRQFPHLLALCSATLRAAFFFSPLRLIAKTQNKSGSTRLYPLQAISSFSFRVSGSVFFDLTAIFLLTARAGLAGSECYTTRATADTTLCRLLNGLPPRVQRKSTLCFA